jgi:hypothetical protein
MVPFILLLLWVVVLALELIYSWAFSYRNAGDRPLGFRKVILWLRIVEKVLYLIVLVVLLGEKYYFVTVLVAGAGLGAPGAVSHRAYWAEVRRQAEFQAKVNNMEWNTAVSIAKEMLDRDLKDGLVFF